MTGLSQDNQRHGQDKQRMLLGINSSPAKPFVLKGATALMECYGFAWFSEDIDSSRGTEASSPPPASSSPRRIAKAATMTSGCSTA